MAIKYANLTAAATSLGIVETDTAGDIGTRWLDAWGDVQKAVINSGIGVSSFTTTVTGTTPTFVPSVTAGELFTVTTPATEYSGVNSQVTGEILKCEVGKPFQVRGKFKLSDATQSDFLFGAMITKTDILNTGTSHGINTGNEGVFFCKLDGATAINAYSYVAGSSTGSASIGTMDTSAHTYEIEWTGTYVKFYFDSVLKASLSASLPTNDLSLSINFRAGEAVAKTLTIYPGLAEIQARS